MPQVAPAAAGHTVAELALCRALPTEAQALTELALRSKAVWGYDEAFMAACRDELAVSARDIEAAGERLTVARLGNQLAGYSWVMPVSREVWELEALFVEPGLMGRGIGQELFRQALRLAGAGGALTLSVQSDPSAAPFYEKAGCIKVGEKESGSLPGRMLPLFQCALAER